MILGMYLKRYGEENKGKRDDYPEEKAVYHYGCGTIGALPYEVSSTGVWIRERERERELHWQIKSKSLSKREDRDYMAKETNTHIPYVSERERESKTPCKCMIRKGKSHDDSVKIKQIMQSEKVETERDK